MEKKVVLFGAGKDAEKFFLMNHLKIVAVIDNKKTGRLNGIPIISLNDYMNQYRECEIFIASSRYAKEITNQLVNAGVTNYVIPDELFESCDVFHYEDILAFVINK